MATKNKKQDEEQEDELEALKMLWKILTDPRYVKALNEDIEAMGKFSANVILALQGKYNGDS